LKDRRATFPMTKRRQKPKKALKNLLAVESAKPRRVASCYGPDQIRDLESTRKDRYSRTFSRIWKMHRTKVSFTNGSWRTIDFDMMIEHAPFTLFNAGDETVLTCLTQNLVFFESAPIEPEKLRARMPVVTFLAGGQGLIPPKMHSARSGPPQGRKSRRRGRRFWQIGSI
jgi:hypothetical protein